MITRSACPRHRRAFLRKGTPLTIINVKPYYVIVCGKQIWCDGNLHLPVVFDTKDLAEICMEDYKLDKCRIRKMELEDLARACRDQKVPFNKFILITDLVQLGMD